MYTDTRRRSRAASVAVGLASLAGLLAFVVGAPMLLTALAGNPLPNHIPTLQEIEQVLSRPDDGTLLVRGIAIAGWVLWGAFTASVLLEAGSRLARLPVRAVPGLGSPRRAAAALISGVIGALTTSQAMAATSAAPTVATAAPVPGQVGANETKDRPEQPKSIQIRVRRGDTLWGLAEKHLGDGRRYREIFELNKNRPQPDGRTLDHEDRVIEGWTLHIPVESAATDDAEVHNVRDGDNLWDVAEQRLGDGSRYQELVKASKDITQPDGRHLENPDLIYPGWQIKVPLQSSDGTTRIKSVASINTSRDETKKPPQPKPDKSVETRDEQPSSCLNPPHEDRSPERKSEQRPTDHVDDDLNAFAAPGPIFGYGGFLAAAVVSVLSYRRFIQRRHLRSGQPIPMPETPLQVETELRHMEDPDGVAFIDRALRSLRARLATREQPIPALSAARYTDEALELHLAQAADAPEGIDQAAPDVWTIRPDTELLDPEIAAETPTPYPALVTIGHDSADSPVLVDLENLRGLSLLGDVDDVQSALRAMALELAASPWTDDMSVTVVGVAEELPDVLEGRIRLADNLDSVLDDLEAHAEIIESALTSANAADLGHARICDDYGDAWTPRIVLCAEPMNRAQLQRAAGLVHERRPAIAIVVAGADDDRLLPGPWLLDAQRESTADGALPWPVRLQHIESDDYQQIIAALRTANQLPAVAASHGGTQSAVIERQQSPDDFVGPKSPEPAEGLEIRILGPIDVRGAEGDLESSKRGQLTELLVYLALHPGATPDAVSEAIWPERDIRISTRNTAMSKLRAWVGKDENGKEYLPTVTSGTSYRLSPAVRLDWSEFRELAERGVDQPGPQGMADLQRAMDLVRGHPFQDVPRRRYNWISADRSNITATIASVAHELAKRLLAEGGPTEARAVLAKARTIRSTNEAIWRDLAQVETDVENFDALQRAHDAYFDECENLGIQPDPETVGTFDRLLNLSGNSR